MLCTPCNAHASIQRDDMTPVAWSVESCLALWGRAPQAAPEGCRVMVIAAMNHPQTVDRALQTQFQAYCSVSHASPQPCQKGRGVHRVLSSHVGNLRKHRATGRARAMQGDGDCRQQSPRGNRQLCSCIFCAELLAIQAALMPPLFAIHMAWCVAHSCRKFSQVQMHDSAGRGLAGKRQ